MPKLKATTEPKSAFIATKVKPSMRDQLFRIAKVEGKSTSRVIREALQAKLNYHDSLK